MLNFCFFYRNDAALKKCPAVGDMRSRAHVKLTKRSQWKIVVTFSVVGNVKATLCRYNIIDFAVQY